MHAHSKSPMISLSLIALGFGAWCHEPSVEASGPRTIEAQHDAGVASTLPARLALIVGIDTYAPGIRSFRTLKGCVRDAERVREVLVERFGFDPEDVVTLVGEEATVEAIVRAFDQHLIRRAGPQTEVVFWFSGHGSRVPDTSGRELGGLDSSLVAWDSRAGERDGSFDLSDDLFASLRSRLTEITQRVTIVTDACHSGGLTRGSAPSTRAAASGREAVDFSLFEAFWPADIPILEDGDPRRRPRAEEGYVHIAACSPKEEAQEIELEDGTTHGALTFFLTRGLLEAQPGTSYEALARGVAVRLATRFPGQNLSYKGAADRTLFGARFAPRTPGHPARVIAGGKLSVQAGTMLGLRPGSVLSIQGEVADDELGAAVVLRASAYSALARWDGEPPDPLPRGALRAIESSRPAGQDPLLVHIALPELADRIEASPLVETVPSGAPNSYRVELVDGRVALIAPDDVHVWTEPEENAEEAWDTPRIRRASRSLLAELREELTYQSLLRLSLGGGGLQLSARFVAPNENELERWPEYPDAGVARLTEASGTTSWNASSNVFRVTSATRADESGLAVLEIGNAADEDVFVAVLSVMEDRSRVLVWPHDGRTEHVPAGRAVRAPIGIQSSPSWALARPMRDRYLVFATTSYADFSVLNRGAQRTRGTEHEALPELIGNALRGPLTRSASPLDLEAADWGVATVDLLVEQPSQVRDGR